MAYYVKAMYKQAPAHYNMAHKNGYCIATLTYYGGQWQNRPPRRLIVVEAEAQCHQLLQQPALADDVRQSLNAKLSSALHDPLFPQKANRTCVVDHLV